MLAVVVISSLVVGLVVLIHYEFLYRITRGLARLRIPHRYRIAVGVLGALLAHATEVWVFASAYFLMNRQGDWGHLEGSFDGSFLDCVYFSFVTFTTLGFGDIAPIGPLRYLAGVESLTGLVLITWSASFLFVEMQRFWDSQ